MTKLEEINFYKNQLQTAKMIMLNAKQLEADATRLESEAKRALELLGNNPERTRKGKHHLSDDLKTKLTASLLK